MSKKSQQSDSTKSTSAGNKSLGAKRSTTHSVVANKASRIIKVLSQGDMVPQAIGGRTPKSRLLLLLDRLKEAGIHHEVRDDRDGAVSVDITVPGERWEIDILEDGSAEIEVFKSDGTIHGESKLRELFTKFSD